jgi:hypothetical protein
MNTYLQPTLFDDRDIASHMAGLLIAFSMVGGFVAINVPRGGRRRAFLSGGIVGVFLALLDTFTGIWGFAVISIAIVWMLWRGLTTLALGFGTLAILFYGLG